MHIRNFRIDRFGGLKDRGGEFSEKLNVVYGPNESGKTTIMEFLRSTLFPGRQRKNYPSHLKTDAGCVTVDIGGVSKNIDRGGGGCGLQMDSSTYRGIFAMTSDDLRDYETISSGDIRNRFLTVPGGKDLPDLIAELNKEMSALMTTDRRTDGTKIGGLLTNVAETKKKLAVTREGDDYNDLYNERGSIEKELKTARAEEAVRIAAEKAASIRGSQTANVDRLENLKKESASLSASDVVKEGDKEKYDSLKSNEKSKKETFDAAAKACSALLPEEYDYKKILANSDRIKRLSEDLQKMLLLRDTPIRRTENPAPRTEKKNGRTIAVAVILVGAIVAAGGLALNILPLTAVGAIVAAVGLALALMKKDRPYAAPSSPRSDAPVQDARVAEYEREVADVAAAIGLKSTYLSTDVRTMSDLLEGANALKRDLVQTADADLEYKTASAGLKEFLAVFGGEEKFLNLHLGRVKRLGLEGQIKTLEDSIKESGYYEISDKETPPDRSEEIRGMDVRLGEISAQMRVLVNDSETDRLRDGLAADESDLLRHARRWGVLSLARSMIDEACSDIYSGMQPAVVSTADRLLTLMTEGRYRLDLDPRNSDISVVSGADSKKESQWSAGLGDQVKLSIKLAVARELSEERLPILLDDVLLTFDSKRKKGACRALRELSEDMQIILFTCDRETASLMREEGCEPIEI